MSVENENLPVYDVHTGEVKTPFVVDYEALDKFLNDPKQFKSGPHYGEVANFSGAKPSLKKAGAEAIAKFLNCRFELTRTLTLQDKDNNYHLFAYDAKMVHIPTGTVLGNAEGLASTYENRYKGKSNTFNEQGVNTVVKMAQKRAFVAVALVVSALSGRFTQDIEDYDKDSGSDDEGNTSSVPSAASVQKSNGKTTVKFQPIDETQRKFLGELYKSVPAVKAFVDGLPRQKGSTKAMVSVQDYKKVMEINENALKEEAGQDISND